MPLAPITGLAGAGSADQLRIEKALPIGATPLKRVAVTGTRTVDGEAPVLRERSLR
jgi:hypothetical protein